MANKRRGTPMYEGADSTPFDQDPIAQELVAQNGPMTYEQIAQIMGTTKENERKVVLRALRKIERALRAMGYDQSDINLVMDMMFPENPEGFSPPSVIA